jgi:V/A-type H+-transporting ATPase subunit E
MSVEGILERIIADAREQADAIIAQAREEEKSILSEGEQEAEEYYKEQLNRLDERYRREKERAVLNRRLDQRKALLQVRQQWMDQAFSDAYARLVEQPVSEYAQLMQKLIAASSTGRDETVVFGTKGTDAELKSIVDAVNNDTGGSFSLAAERGDFPWGFTLRKGKVETNVSIDSLFRYRRSDLEQKAWELFNAK